MYVRVRGWRDWDCPPWLIYLRGYYFGGDGAVHKLVRAWPLEINRPRDFAVWNEVSLFVMLTLAASRVDKQINMARALTRTSAPLGGISLDLDYPHCSTS
jgi:hypothetical protein